MAPVLKTGHPQGCAGSNPVLSASLPNHKNILRRLYPACCRSTRPKTLRPQCCGGVGISYNRRDLQPFLPLLRGPGKRMSPETNSTNRMEDFADVRRLREGFALIKRCESLCDSGRQGEAYRLISANLNLLPRHADYQTACACLLCELGYYEEAFAVCDAILKTSPQAHTALWWKAFSLYRLERIGEALDRVRRAAPRRPRNIPTRHGCGPLRCAACAANAPPSLWKRMTAPRPPTRKTPAYPDGSGRHSARERTL